MTEKTINIERAEKVSSLIRNALLIGGALLTAGIYVYDKWNSPFTVHVRSTYVSSENTRITYVDEKLKPSTTMTGILGTLSKATLRNGTNSSVALEVKIPSIENPDATDPKADDPRLFTIVEADPGCSIDKKDISITNSGLLRAKMNGTVTLAKFPPECSLTISIASTQISNSSRLMNGHINVFYDGKKATVIEATELYSPIARYIERIEDGGWQAFVFLLLVPLLLIIVIVGWLGMLLMRAAANSHTDNSVSPAAEVTSVDKSLQGKAEQN